MPETMTLRDRFARDGYLVVPDFVSREAVARLRARAFEIAETVPAAAAVSSAVFSTSPEARIKSEEYFLSSGPVVRCFYEEGAVDADGRLTRPASRAVNKIGHAMHDLDPVFERFSHTPELARLADAIGLRDPRVYQSMVIFKQPEIGGEVGWHQDASFFATEPESVVTLWFALEDADLTNGCLMVAPGEHRGPLRERFVVEDGRSRMIALDDAPWPEPARAIPLEVAAGTLVVFHGRLPHYSGPNRSPRSRLAYTLHAVSGEAAYAPSNWLQRTARFPARGFGGPVAIRRFGDGDAPAVCEVYFRSVHEVACSRYTEAQVDAWAPRVPDPQAWLERLRSYETFVAEDEGRVVAWIAMSDSGYVDMLFCLPEAAGRGIASRLYLAVEAAARVRGLARLTAHASLLAQPFFARHGWAILRPEIIVRNGVEIPRAEMAKDLELRPESLGSDVRFAELET